MAAVDTKRGYVGTCNGRSAQQESGVALSKIIIYSYYTRCALIREVETVERRKRCRCEEEKDSKQEERRERDAAAKRRENSVFTAGAYNYIQLLY